MKRTKPSARQQKQTSRKDSDNRNMDRNTNTTNKPVRRRNHKELEHVCIFKPCVAVDWQGNDTYYGLCECGETDG